MQTNERITCEVAPSYDLAGNVMSVALIIPLDSPTQTVPAGKTFSFARFSQESGADVEFSCGDGSTVQATYSSATASPSSSQSSSLYGGVFHGTNKGAGTVRGAHLSAIAIEGSTGHISASAHQIQPASTTPHAWGSFVSLNGAVNDRATAYGVESAGARYSLVLGNLVAPIPVANAFVRWWRHAASAVGARFLQLLNQDGSENSYWDQNGNVGVYSIVLKPTTVSSPVNGQMWWDGLNLRLKTPLGVRVI